MAIEKNNQDLIDLVEACHQKNIWVMVDVVANHVNIIIIIIE